MMEVLNFRTWDGTTMVRSAIDCKKIMRFSGMNDANDKGIYEGDIIQSGDKVLGSVGFEYGCFVLKAFWIDNETNSYPELKYYIGMRFLPKTIVIGNIYENPEIIKEGQL